MKYALKNIAWFFQHPLYATCWALTGQPWSRWFNFWGAPGKSASK